MTGPIRPDEIAIQPPHIPEAVFDVFNALITKHWDGHRAVVWQDDALARIVEKLGVMSQYVVAEKWLNVEGAYRDAGWSVTYDKPGYNETGDAKFIFTRKT